MWMGREVEGVSNLGEMTLFARGGDIWKALDQHKDITRVWLCKEYLAKHDIEATLRLLQRLVYKDYRTALEVPYEAHGVYQRLYAFAVVYVKLELPLRLGDHICVGYPFRDESFEIGRGNIVTPDSYKADIPIE